MSEAAAYASLQRRRIRTRAQHSLVVIRFDYQHVELVEGTRNAFRHVSEIVDDSRARALTDRCHDHGNRLVRVVRDGNCFQMEIAYYDAALSRCEDSSQTRPFGTHHSGSGG